MSGWIDPDLMRPIGWALVHFLWQGALIAGVVALLSLVVKKAAARYLLFCGGLAAMAASPVVTALWVHRDSAKPLEFVLAPTMAVGAEEPWIPWLTGVWIAGVAVCILRLVVGCLQVQKLRRMAADKLPKEWADRVLELSNRVGVRQKVRMLIVDRLDVPATIGTVRALILMPACALARLSNDQLEALIAHELAHIKRYDYLVNLVQSFIEAVLFYHPAVWWISKQIRNEREHACDDIAVGAIGDALVYARALERLETIRSSPAPSLAMAVNGGSVCDRIRRLIGLPTKTRQRLFATPFVALALGAITMVAVSAKAVASATDAKLPKSDTKLFVAEKDPIPAVEEVLLVRNDLDKSFALLPRQPVGVHFVEGKNLRLTMAKSEKGVKAPEVHIERHLSLRLPEPPHELRKVEIHGDGSANYTFQVSTADLSVDDFMGPDDSDPFEVTDERVPAAPTVSTLPASFMTGEKAKGVWIATATTQLRSALVYAGPAFKSEAAVTTFKGLERTQELHSVEIQLSKAEGLMKSEMKVAFKGGGANFFVGDEKAHAPFMGKVNFQAFKNMSSLAKDTAMTISSLTSAAEAEKWAKLSEMYEKGMKNVDWTKAQKAWVESVAARQRAEKIQVIGRKASAETRPSVGTISVTGYPSPALTTTSSGG